MRATGKSVMRSVVWYGLIVMLVLASVGGGVAPQRAWAAPPLQESPDAAAANDNMILSYAAKFVCQSALKPGEFYYGLNAPIVKQETQVLVHNPNAFAVTIFKKAVLAPVENPTKVEQGVAPGKWVRVVLGPDYAFHVDCDDVAKLLTGKADATFLSAFPIVGTTIEGFVVIGSGVQTVAGTNVRRLGVLDVTAEYVRSSEFLKKDIHYQPWWRWWWWNLPWRLGYAYQRVLPAQPLTNIDCRDALYRSLMEDANNMSDPQLRQHTVAALEAGLAMDQSNMESTSAQAPTALVALIGRCDKVGIGTQLAMSIDYVLVSNKGPTDPDPRNPTAASVDAVRYPWLPGRWYDLALVTPQNLDVDMQRYMREWQTRTWVAANNASDAAITSAMAYYFPYWCGWGYWWWWWNAGDCVDIAVGAAESLDVEAVTPVRVFMPQWPPL